MCMAACVQMSISKQGTQAHCGYQRANEAGHGRSGD